ncbi:queuosine precursor transporter [Primorskyibacter aestuariivivens]|uniref:queuosine precursor transporter n=1 Tax=Primorskyibacter aestuariivivens TaxID=1888912 RepID=UPI0023011E52|nr:queuosine precursor transporter [Primorskyibacter aestuariivivens]MDA7427730.1 queuosine precursor transporter [Primorskyibacter aestuariivivens]
MNRTHLPGILAMAAIVVASNILVQFLILDGLLTWGAFTYPLAFLVTDVMNRVYGAGPARKVVFAGFVTGVACSLIGSQIMLQGDGYTYAAVPLRIAVASGFAFLVAQMTDIAVFNRFREGRWWRAPLVSTLVGSALDTALFFTIAFSASVTFFGPDADAAINWAWEAVPFMLTGPEAPLWVTLAFADWLVKLSIALIALIPFRAIVARLSENRALA